MFCPECGTKLDEDTIFCPECGTRVAELLQEQPNHDQPSHEQPPLYQEPVHEPVVTDEPEVPVTVKGLILTNLKSLAARLSTDTDSVRLVIENYIRQLRAMGVEYKLLDAGDYTYPKSGLFGSAKHVSLTGHDSWAEFAAITKAEHDKEEKNKEKYSEYLFIIGGAEDVPMPTLPMIRGVNSPDANFDTDLLYAFPYGKEMERKLINQEIFKYDALFYVGRLPIAKDGSLEDLEDYLHRAVKMHLHVPADRAYTQIDPHWFHVTYEETQPLRNAHLYPPGRVDDNDEVYNSDLYLTPYITIDPRNDMQKPYAFDEDANVFLINMHGSNVLDSYYFYGEPWEKGPYPPGLAPAQIAAIRRPNIIFAQPCYGGRFINYPKRKSMLLTAMTHQTLTYVGSSRVSFGTVAKPNQPIKLFYSDVLSKVFFERMLAGYSAGAAFFDARIATYKVAPGDPAHALSIAEFNLYGDPLIRMGNQQPQYSSDKSARMMPNEQHGVMQEQILMSKSVDNQPVSLLDQVRNAVDQNILEITKIMADNLYKQYNIPPREPSVIAKRTWADGHQDLAVVYSSDCGEHLHNDIIAISDEKGNVQTVIQTK